MSTRRPPPPPPGQNPPRRPPPPPPPSAAPAQGQPLHASAPTPAPAQPVAEAAPAGPALGLERRPLGELLIDEGIITHEQLAEALSIQHLESERVGESLVRLEHCTELEVMRGLGRQFGLPVLDKLADAEIQDELCEQLPIGYARGNLVLPWRLDADDDRLDVLAADPLKLDELDDLATVYDADLEVTLIPPSVILELINKTYSKRTKDVDLEQKEDEYGEEDEDILHASAEDAPIIRFVNSLIFNASKSKASDIHIEPGDKEVVVRYRVDGVLKEVRRAPKGHLSSIVARVKIMAGLNIAEKRLPQDGRIRRKIAGKEVDMRVATAPVSHGERITIRLLDKSAVMLDLDTIGIAPDHLRIVKETIHRPHGIFLVTGPTGSGKTTTLYSALSEINTPDLNILTVEDPVEFQLQGISQVQVNAKIDLTFAKGLRSFLRHDPDVIMVGEIRDLETAEIAIQASLTGHLVLSTIHTNDAATGITRLVDMGVQPFLVASSLVALQAQRLIRRVCPHCARAVAPDPKELDEMGIIPEAFFAGEQCLKVPVREEDGTIIPITAPKGYSLPPQGTLWAAEGCDKCNGTGYRGRTGVYELLAVTEEIRRLAIRNASGAEIKRAAIEQGLRTLRDDGAHKVLSGISTIDEVMRVTAEEA
ncbi:type II secretion system protein E [Plesiocystis pacifica SIR-1]|uniref:protein-secreting ATPase n=1 Tax=Plesiocystis pacifica SIR-1 TaxID=391625 RepID=A6FZI6_9BACT|nr:type II secretion system ATPase GspE [Plesiocystis pacifica]EDM81070.1 type II secretion system protein E [Plesiocystis pacifica SIR-1]